MNKIFKSTLIAVVATMGLATTSCTNEYSYDAASASGEQVYFGSDMSTTVETPKSASSFSVTVRRINTLGTVTVPVTITQSEGSIYTPAAQQVTFADGADSAPLTFTYNPDDVVYGTYYDITVQLNDATLGSPYGLTSYSFKAGATAWVDYGTASYREDYVGIFFGVDNVVYDVPIQRNTVEEGMYRLVNPYGAAYEYNADGDYDTSQDYYLTINAKDPDYVYIEESPTGMDWGYGVFTMWSMPGFRMVRSGLTFEECKAQYGAYFGTLKDGVITMPSGSLLMSMANYQNGGFYAGGKGLFAVALPGYAIADMSAEVSYAGIFTDAANNVFAVGNLTLGADASNVKAVVVSQDADADAVADAVAAGELEAIDVVAGSIQVPISADLTGKLQIVVVVMDSENAVKTVATADFEYYGGGANPWQSLGKATYYEDFIGSVFSIGVLNYEVEIEENSQEPGMYRLINPYENYPANEEGDFTPGSSFNIEINATDPEGVYILKQPIGMDWGYGDMYIQTQGAFYLENGNSYDTVKSYGWFGTLKDKVITFPYGTRDASDGTKVPYGGWLWMGDSRYYGGANQSIAIVLPGANLSSAARRALERNLNANNFERRLNMVPSQKVSKKDYLKSSILLKRQ